MTARLFGPGTYFHGVRLHAVVSLAVGAALSSIVLVQPASLGFGVLMVLQELLAPLPGVVVAAGLLQADPALGLVAATRTSLARLLIGRWLVALLVGMTAPLALHVSATLAIPDVAVQPLVWLAPLLFLSALAMAAAAVFASAFAGLGIAAGYWAAAIATLPALQALCSARPEKMCHVALWSTAFTSIAPSGSAWELNRALLLGASAVLALGAAACYRNPERQLATQARAGDDA